MTLGPLSVKRRWKYLNYPGRNLHHGPFSFSSPPIPYFASWPLQDPSSLASFFFHGNKITHLRINVLMALRGQGIIVESFVEAIHGIELFAHIITIAHFVLNQLDTAPILIPPITGWWWCMEWWNVVVRIVVFIP